MTPDRQNEGLSDDSRLTEARALHRDGRVDLAIPVYQEVLARHPDHPEALHLLGLARLQTSDIADAEKLLIRASGLAPDNPKIVNNCGVALFEQGRIGKAMEKFSAAIKLDETFVDAHFNLGRAYQGLRKFGEAIQQYGKAIELQSDHFGAHNNLGVALLAQGSIDRAIETARAAMRLRPDSPEPMVNLVMALEAKNQIHEASEIIARLVDMAPDLISVRILRARIAVREGKLDEALEMLESLLADEPTPDEKCTALIDLAALLDQRKEYRRAFSTTLEWKSIDNVTAATASFDVAAAPAHVARYRAWLETARLPDPVDLAEDGSAGPVFFAGFPRSGTTLMEQVFASHPGLVTTSERSPLWRAKNRARQTVGRQLNFPLSLADMTESEVTILRSDFLQVAREITGSDLSRHRLIEKLPLNIVELGSVNQLFPEARAIIALRDPRDVALSCFMQSFKMNESMVQFTDLERTGRYYAQVMGLWLRYREKLTIPWTEYRYEDLVGDFDGTVRSVLEFIGVPWADSVRNYFQTALNAEVRSPSYAAVTEKISNKAIGRWRNYRRELAPILPLLDPFVKEFGYDPD